MDYIESLSAARFHYFQTVRWTTLDPELVEYAQRVSPDGAAKMLADVAELAATLPALKATLDGLEARACSKCQGTGEFGGPTNATREGRPYCFQCNGRGCRKG